jgi:hypothetical protein
MLERPRHLKACFQIKVRFAKLRIYSVLLYECVTKIQWELIFDYMHTQNSKITRMDKHIITKCYTTAGPFQHICWRLKNALRFTGVIKSSTQFYLIFTFFLIIMDRQESIMKLLPEINPGQTDHAMKVIDASICRYFWQYDTLYSLPQNYYLW